MAGTVHEVENHALLAEVEREAANAAQELVEAARLHRGQIVVIGCSTSEVVGHQVGSWSTPEAAQAIFRGLQSVFAPRGVYLAAQCCEHLNRALIVEHDAVPNAEIVNVLPQPKAGSSFATAASRTLRSISSLGTFLSLSENAIVLALYMVLAMLYTCVLFPTFGM